MIKRIKAALVSGQKAAYCAMLYMIIGPVTRLLDRLFGRSLRKEKVANYEVKGLIILGISRSGSTVINQVLTRTLPVVYRSNLHMLFPSAADEYMHKRNLYGSANMSVRNYYGYTASLYDVNEANEMLAFVFGTKDREERNNRFLAELRKLGVSVDQPFILKNVVYAEDLMALSKDFPGLSFLKVDRDLERISRSVLRGYHELGYFNPIPRALQGKKMQDPVEFSVLQALEMERQLEEEMMSLPEGRLIRWSYEDFCQDPQKHIEEVRGLLDLPEGSRPFNSLGIQLRQSKGPKVTEEESKAIKEHIQKLTA